MTADPTPTMRASRYRVARARGALSGVLLMLLGAWAALVPFIGPYLNVAYTPQPDTAWHWTAARGWLEVTPGAVAFVAGVLLVIGTSRVLTVLCAWLAAASGAWLVVGPACASPLHIDLGTPDPASRRAVQTLEQVAFFFGIGALIVFVAGIALGRLTVTTMRDQRAAERRLAAEPAGAPLPRAGQSDNTGPAYRPQQPPPAPAAPAPERNGPPAPGPDATQGDQPTTQYPTYAAAPPPREN